MATSYLALRPLATVALALVLAPLIGLTSYWLSIMTIASMEDQSALSSAAVFLLLMLMIGGPICWLVELVFIVPLLLGFHRYRWPWLNGWWGAIFGAALGYLASLSLVFVPLEGMSEGGTVEYVHNGVRTPAGWENAFITSLGPALVGLVSALVFRALAVRRRERAHAD